MIIKTYPSKNLYGKYFLATEAPDDETVTEDQPKPRRNVKVISVKPSNRSTDFNTVNDDIVEEEVPEETTDQAETDTPPTETPEEETQPTEVVDVAAAETGEDGPDVGGEDDFTTTDEPTDETNHDVEEPTDTPVEQPDTGDETTDFTATDDATADTGEEGPDVGGDEDFTASDEPTTDTTTNQDAPQAQDNGGKPNAPGVDFDSTRKYNLYKEYMSLYNACSNYISKLENVMKNDNVANQIIRISVTNLREIRDILSDYMTIRYQINSYIQSLLFYQKMVVAVQLVFNLLKSIEER